MAILKGNGKQKAFGVVPPKDVKIPKTYELSEKERLKILANLIIDQIIYDFKNNELKKGV